MADETRIFIVGFVKPTYKLGPLTLGIAFFRLNTDKRIVRTKCDVAV